MTVAVIVPTIRAGSVQRVRDSLWATVSRDEARLVFVVESDHIEVQRAVHLLGEHLVINERSRNYAGAVNTALHRTDEPGLFIAADDVAFHPGWLPPLLESAEDFGLVGTNDLYNSDVLAGRHATHYYVTRQYALTGCADAPGQLLHEGYIHNYCDVEAVETAMKRGQFASRLDSIVEHLHYAWGLAPMDEGYEKSTETAWIDRARYEGRRHLWT